MATHLEDLTMTAPEQIMAEIRANYFKKTKLFRTATMRATKLASIADPATGGNQCLVRNWGNEAANRIWSETMAKERKASEVYNARYTELMRAYVRASGGNPVF